MNVFQIGLLAAMPFLVTVFQLPVSYLMGRNGRRKEFWFWGATAARMMWVPVIMIALVPASMIPSKTAIVLILILFSHICISISHVAWLSLMSDLVPDALRGRFFGTRNMLCGAVGLVAMLVFGRALDFANAQGGGLAPLGFGVTFATAVLFGAISLYFLRRIADPHAAGGEVSPSLGADMLSPVRESNFRRFLLYGFFWSFSVHFASPFLTLYFLTNLKFSYGFVAALGVASALADLAGMRLWGKISDRVKNKPIITFASWVAAFIPFAWLFVRPESVVVPVLINIVAGGFWAGINLCTNNLLLRISPQQNKGSYLSLYNVAVGIGAAASPILAGALVTYLNDIDFTVMSWKPLPLHMVFLISTAFRLVSLHLFSRIREPEEIAVGEMVRILKGIRGLNIASGFSYVLHPFIELSRGGFKNGFGNTLEWSEIETKPGSRLNSAQNIYEHSKKG
jgi:MFS family permease